MRIISVCIGNFNTAGASHSENKECSALLLMYGASVFEASVPVLKSPSLFREIFHLISKRSFCKSMKLFLSPKT